MAKPKTYPSIVSLLLGECKRETAEIILSQMYDLMAEQNMELSQTLTALINDCRVESPSGVRCPSRSTVERAVKIMRRYGAIFPKKSSKARQKHSKKLSTQ